MHLSDFLIRNAIITDLLATTKEGAIREIVRSVQDTGPLAGVDTEILTRAFMEREILSATTLGKGAACPHGGHESVDRVFGTIAISRQGVEFNSFDGKPVHIILLLFHTPDQFAGPIRPGDIYDAFKAFARFHQDDRFLDRLRQCRTREQVFDLIVEGDREAGGTQLGCERGMTMKAKRSIGMAVVAVINVVFGAMIAFGNTIEVIREETFDHIKVTLPLRILGLGGGACAAALAIGGIGIWLVRPYGRVMTLIAAVGTILVNALATLYGLPFNFFLAGSIYPALLLILFNLPKWKIAFTAAAQPASAPS